MSSRQEISWDWEKMPLSKSMVHMFEQCPYRFFLQFIDRYPFEKTPEMAEGNRLHDELDQLYKKIDKTEIVTAADIAEAYRKCLPPVIQMQRFIELEQKRFSTVATKNFWPVLTERFLEDKELMYFGTLDRFDINERGIGVVIDYKMGKFHKWLETKYRFELMGYKHLLKANQKKLAEEGIEFKAITYGVIVFLGGDETIVWEQEIKAVTERTFYKKIPHVRGLIQKYDEEGEWPKKITPLCAYCPFAGKPCQLEQQLVGEKKEGD